MRQQEDQIYALQDDLANYQQLVCQYRAENESLKQQLADSQPVRTVPAKLPANVDAGKSRLKSSPEVPSTQPPRQKGPRLGEPESQSGVPKLELGEPEVPPLKDSSRDETQHPRETLHATSQSPTLPMLHVVGYEVEPKCAHGDWPSCSVYGGGGEFPDQVILRGQVQKDSTAEGPRILADVECELASGQPVAYRGQMSLMVLDPGLPGRGASLARWEFTGNDLDQAAIQTFKGPALEFPLQLPASVPVNRPVELWVRLLQENGQKVLAHATIDLSRSGQFCSAERPSPPPVTQAVQVEAAGPLVAESRASNVQKTEWQVASPDHPVGLMISEETATSQWRAATQPIPEVPKAIERIESPQPVFAPVEASKLTFHPQPSDARPKCELSDWSPEPAASSKLVAPVWSPSR
jgi:hypothetical protein